MSPEELRAAFISAVVERAGELSDRQRDELADLLPPVPVPLRHEPAVCERPKCGKPTTGDLRYCSDRCFDLDNDPNPVQPISRNKAGGFGFGLSRSVREPVVLPKAQK